MTGKPVLEGTATAVPNLLPKLLWMLSSVNHLVNMSSNSFDISNTLETERRLAPQGRVFSLCY